MSFLNVLAAAAAAYVFGAIWYGIWAKPWMAATGITEEDIRGPEGKQSFVPYVIAAICVIVVASMMRHLFIIAEINEVKEGAITGLSLGLFMVMPWVITNYAYSMRPRNLALIDGGYITGGCMLIGIVLPLF